MYSKLGRPINKSIKRYGPATCFWRFNCFHLIETFHTHTYCLWRRHLYVAIAKAEYSLPHVTAHYLSTLSNHNCRLSVCLLLSHLFPKCTGSKFDVIATHQSGILIKHGAVSEERPMDFIRNIQNGIPIHTTL